MADYAHDSPTGTIRLFFYRIETCSCKPSSLRNLTQPCVVSCRCNKPESPVMALQKSACPLFLSLCFLDMMLWDGSMLVVISQALLSHLPPLLSTRQEGCADPGAALQGDGSLASLTHNFAAATSFQ